MHTLQMAKKVSETLEVQGGQVDGVPEQQLGGQDVFRQVQDALQLLLDKETLLEGHSSVVGLGVGLVLQGVVRLAQTQHLVLLAEGESFGLGETQQRPLGQVALVVQVL